MFPAELLLPSASSETPPGMPGQGPPIIPFSTNMIFKASVNVGEAKLHFAPTFFSSFSTLPTPQVVLNVDYIPGWERPKRNENVQLEKSMTINCVACSLNPRESTKRHEALPVGSPCG